MSEFRILVAEAEVRTIDGMYRLIDELQASGPAATSLLLSALNDNFMPVRIHAARALGRLGYERSDVMATLLGILHDPNPELVAAASRAIANIRVYKYVV